MSSLIRGTGGSCRRRAGAALAELTVAILLAGIAAAIGVAILVAAERRTRADGAADRGAQTARDVARLLTGEIEPALPDSIFVRGDTALDLDAHIGTSVVCVASASAVVLPGTSATAGAAFTYWRQAPESGDLMLLWDSTSGGRWQRALVGSVSTPPAGGGCPTTSGYRSVGDSVAQVAVTRVQLVQLLAAGVVAGAPVRVFRGARWFLHRGTDRLWTLGYRRCLGAVCGQAQPVAGPLASPADSGLAFRIAPAGTVEISVRSSAATVRLRFVVAVRGASNGPP